MSKVLVLYYSSYGHIETMANAVAEGAQSAGATVDIKRVPETAPLRWPRRPISSSSRTAPVAAVADLEGYDAIIVGTPTRFGRMPSQMASFLDQAGGLWAPGALNGKVGGAFTSTATQHGGQEVDALFSDHQPAALRHDHRRPAIQPPGPDGIDEIVGGSPYGATTIAGGQGQRQPSAIDLEGARHQGKLIAQTANKLFGG